MSEERMTVDQAVDALDEIFADESESQESSEESLQKDTQEQDTQDAETAEQEEEQSETEDNSNEEQEAQEETQELDLDSKLKFQLDGQEQELTIEELTKGYSRQSDYTRKTQELAEQRKELEELNSSVSQEKQKYIEKLAQDISLAKSVASKILDNKYSEADLEDLRKNDPAEYSAFRLMQQDDEKRLNDFITEQQTELKKLVNEQQEVFTKEQTESLAKQKEAVIAKFPDLKDKNSEFSNSLTKYLETNNFKQDEINSLSDVRHFELINKARLYDELQAQTSKKVMSSKKVVKVPKYSKSGNTTTKTKSTKDVIGSVKAGNINSAVSALEELGF